MHLKALLASLTLLILFAWSLADDKKMEPGPKSPQESLACIKTRPGFTVELMAAEPLVQSPIAFAWGPDGKFWVVEMGDYPLGIDGKGKPGGRIKILTKSRENGPYDKATVFLDGLGFPTGVTPFGKGVIVTCAPRSSMPKTPRARAMRTRKSCCSPASSRAIRSTASTAWSTAWITGGTEPTAIREALSNRSKPIRKPTSAAATFASGPTTAPSKRKPARPSSAGRATTSATGSATVTPSRFITSSSMSIICAATHT